jgi:signal transduction histidine kinase
LKGHFISNITNEIVNPFASVLALAENIKRLKNDEMETAHRMADLIYDEAFHLDFQLKNIFAAALIEAGSEEPKVGEINIDVLGNYILNYFNSQIGKRGITLSAKYANLENPDTPILFLSDREKLEMITKNLVSNSIKYSPNDAEINLEFVLGKRNLCIEVSDHGKGIRPNNREVIFDRFKQLDEKINSINTGHGLGLSIVQAYTELLGGKVSLNDNVDGGVRIMVSIPESVSTEDWDDLEDFLLDNKERF